MHKKELHKLCHYKYIILYKQKRYLHWISVCVALGSISRFKFMHNPICFCAPRRLPQIENKYLLRSNHFTPIFNCLIGINSFPISYVNRSSRSLSIRIFFISRSEKIPFLDSTFFILICSTKLGIRFYCKLIHCPNLYVLLASQTSKKEYHE